ncbi:MAG: serine--tRNA ligase [Candidatus Eremiobacteraeota bacterium]|nr:serine--tRNA ligase [Candidatus Eremiobacteraeota bacterium]MBC5803393.1 serine--tRNA ligase [Candidatus Eremiobacteraeota bacterium]MBC5822515.1 serine--tRNA ligase [Candidatus Eremiobacteraeota bacterium]
MLDLALLRRDPERVRRAAARRMTGAGFVDEVLTLDVQLRAARTTVEQRKAQKNALTAQIGRAADRAAEAGRLRPEIAALDAQIAAAADAMPGLEAQIDALLADVPNLLDDSVPDGASEDDNVLVRDCGPPPELPFAAKPHWEIGEALGILDFDRAAKLSGSRFAVLRGAGARLSRGLINFFLSRAHERGYTEVVPPFLVSRATMWSTGQLTKFSDAMFRDVDGELFMIPTSEVPLTALHRDEILAPGTLPLHYTAYSPCFRKEAGAAGKDTRGLIRQHQFEKVELVWLTEPERSSEALERLTADAEALLQELELPYRVMLLCSADVGFNAAMTYDLEVWLPGQQTYREISSCSNCTDFQARRSQIRFRREATAKPELVHTLNGSGLAVGRALVAILENYQEADGSVIVPRALVPFVGFERISRNGD